MSKSLLVLILVGLAAVGGIAALQHRPATAAPLPKVVMESNFALPVVLPVPSGALEVYHYVVDYAPGAFTAVHHHPIGCVATVVEGQVTNHFPNSRAVAGPGRTLVTYGNESGQHSNDSGSQRATYFATCLAYAGGPFAVVDETAPAPIVPASVLFAAAVPMPQRQAQVKIVQQVMDFEPGSSSARMVSNGSAMLSVLSGQLSVASPGADKALGTGATFSAVAGQSFTATNPGVLPTRVVATYVLPIATSPVSTGPSPSPITPPSTGNGGLLLEWNSFSGTSRFASLRFVCGVVRHETGVLALSR